MGLFNKKKASNEPPKQAKQPAAPKAPEKEVQKAAAPVTPQAAPEAKKPEAKEPVQQAQPAPKAEAAASPQTKEVASTSSNESSKKNETKKEVGEMLFQTTAAHEELRAKVRAFAEKEIAPIAFSLDQQNEFPDKQVKEMGTNGWMGIPYPKEYGGAGLDVISYAIAVEELARVDGGAGVILSAHTSLGAYPIAAFGTEEQKKKYLVPLAKGEKIGAFGLTEENAGSDAGGTETTAVDKGDHYLLNGGKIFITNAPKADTYVVFAVTTPDIGTRGISAFIVEKGWPGFDFGDHYDKLGIRSSSTAELIFNDVKVPKENLLGKEGQGFKIAMATLDGGRIGIGAQAVGIAQGAIDECVKYVKERVQFGKPICAFQNTQFELADMQTKVDAARLLVFRAAQAKQDGEPYGHMAAMAKLFASETASDVTRRALQLAGGYGYTREYPFERFMRDAKITEIYEGTSEVQRMVVSGWMLK